MVATRRGRSVPEVCRFDLAQRARLAESPEVRPPGGCAWWWTVAGEEAGRSAALSHLPSFPQTPCPRKPRRMSTTRPSPTSSSCESPSAAWQEAVATSVRPQAIAMHMVCLVPACLDFMAPLEVRHAWVVFLMCMLSVLLEHPGVRRLMRVTSLVVTSCWWCSSSWSFAAASRGAPRPLPARRGRSVRACTVRGTSPASGEGAP
ncbi:unnamed protein product [Prorocentrum cordatum]|uniref:Mannosyltransferase n=1 Tax=Prorocentrum cordatum TaxID=2364126 RepID=A0ABN9TWM6_9DINO|nr:unnamed protein product [Polarella glacialis]